MMKGRIDYESLLTFVNVRIRDLEEALNSDDKYIKYIEEFNYDLKMYKIIRIILDVTLGHLTGSICNDSKCKLFAMDGEDEDAYIINLEDTSLFVLKEEFEAMKPFLKKAVDERK